LVVKRGDPGNSEAEDSGDPLSRLLLEELARAGVDESTDPDTFSRLVESGLAAVTDAAADTLLTELPKGLRRRRKHAAGFERRLRDPWGPALDLLETLIDGSVTAGSETNRRERPGAARDQDFVFEALVRLHARSCLVAREVLVLLRTGLASGANARWRTLHELAVIACFVREHDRDVAERYLLHHLISRARGLRDHQRFAARLGTTPFSAAETERITGMRDRLCARFGKEYTEEYGWASAALGKPKPSFRDIEEATNLDHWRPYFRMASHGVHAGPHGLVWDLGSHDKEIMLAGPSNAGLADPGMGAAISLNLVSVSLLASRISPRSLTWMKALDKLATRTRDAFFEAHEELERRIADEAPSQTDDSDFESNAGY
jgi:hypothetical protein